MSTDPSAKLFFGYAWGEDEVDGEAATISPVIDEMLAAAGVEDPWRDRRPGAENQAVLDARRAAGAEAKKRLGVDWGIHGSEYDLRRHLYALGSLVEVEWSDTAVVTALTLNQAGQEAWVRQLDGYLKRAGIPRPEGETVPQWHLASLYF